MNVMKTALLNVVVCLCVILAGSASQKAAEKKKNRLQYVETDTGLRLVHDDVNTPAPAVITPGTGSTQEKVGRAPSDAIVLFGGPDPNLSEWTSRDGRSRAKWIVRDDYMESVRGSGPVKTSRRFGSCQLHVEFATPSTVRGRGQGRGNSGIFIMDTYEIQILDSYENKTYPDGQCAALYGRAIPLVNACRKPGQWQSFDIIFHRPIFEGQKVVKKATFTVLHNGVLVHDHVQLQGGTGWIGPHEVTEYKPHDDKLPIMLQDHGNPVMFRNIWIRELED